MTSFCKCAIINSLNSAPSYKASNIRKMLKLGAFA
nr:MAG TPA: hypothetical protein [Caudoviricetes sp.]